MKPSKIETTFEAELKNTALIMAVYCARNTIIENYHAGTIPQSKTGDYSDVKVVTPFGDIPWNEVSRINDTEMKAFNKEVANNIYTYLHFSFNEQDKELKQTFIKMVNKLFPQNWDEPTLKTDVIKSLKNIQEMEK